MAGSAGLQCSVSKASSPLHARQTDPQCDKAMRKQYYDFSSVKRPQTSRVFSSSLKSLDQLSIFSPLTRGWKDIFPNNVRAIHLNRAPFVIKGFS